MTEDLFNKISIWQQKTFPDATVLGKLFHLKEEVEELLYAVKNNDKDKRLEYADCFMLLFGAAAKDGMSYQDIVKAVEYKLEINKLRSWGQPDDLGIIRHLIKGGINDKI